MPSINTPTALERASGHVATEAVFTLVGALSGSPLAALLPVLANSLASERQQKRVEDALIQIDTTLNAHAEALRNLTDSQYKLINEAILALLQTTNTEKIEYLRRAVHNSLVIGGGILAQEAVVLARIIRDISADEADFLVKNFHYDRIQLASASADHEQKVLTVAPDSQEGLVITGLVSLGLLSAAEPTWDESGLMRFSPIVAKLLVLLREPNPSQEAHSN
jgi:hypothetical protein